MNLAVELLREIGESVEDFDGLCGELVDLLIHKHGEEKVDILYVDGDLKCGDLSWFYHMAAVIDGVVHDAWFPKLVLPPDEYLKTAFPNQNPQSKLYGEG